MFALSFFCGKFVSGLLKGFLTISNTQRWNCCVGSGPCFPASCPSVVWLSHVHVQVTKAAPSDDDSCHLTLFAEAFLNNTERKLTPPVWLGVKREVLAWGRGLHVLVERAGTQQRQCVLPDRAGARICPSTFLAQRVACPLSLRNCFPSNWSVK